MVLRTLSMPSGYASVIPLELVMLIMGFYSLVLIVLEAALISCSLIRQQRFAVWISAAGLAVLFFWGLTVYFELSLPYQELGLNIYFVLIFGMILALAGGFGLVVKGLKALRK